MQASNDDFAAIIQYEKKVLSYQELDNPDDGALASVAMKMANVPIETREFIRIGIYEDGTSNWEITQLPVDNKDIPTWKSALDAKTTRYFKDKAMYFDENGRFLHEINIPTPRFEEFIRSLKGQKPNNVFFGIAQSTKTNTNLNEIIDAWDNYLVYKSTYTDISLGSLTEYNVIDTSRSILMGGELYDQQGKLLSSTQNFYTSLPGEIIVPLSETQQVNETTSNGLPFTLKIFTEYSCYEFINNLK